MNGRLNKRTILITGAAGGIGAAAARRLAAEGARVMLADRDGDGAAALAAELGQAAVPVDVTDQAAIEAMVEAVYSRWGRLDVLFNNAGVAQAKPMLEITTADRDRVHNVNLRARLLRDAGLRPAHDPRNRRSPAPSYAVS